MEIPKRTHHWYVSCARDAHIPDEISMVRGVFFHRLERIAREIRGDPRPFGGIQLILSGDFLQLPPVPGMFRSVLPSGLTLLLTEKYDPPTEEEKSDWEITIREQRPGHTKAIADSIFGNIVNKASNCFSYWRYRRRRNTI